MKPTDPTAPASARRRPSPSRSRLLRLWTIVSAAYVLVAAAASAGPLQATVERALAAAPRPAAAQPLHPSGGPIPEAPDGRGEMLAKAIGLEALLLAGPPLLLLWFGWDVWFALAGFFPGAAGLASDRAEPGRE